MTAASPKAIACDAQKDAELIEEISSLRSMRLTLAEKQLADLDHTTREFIVRGYAASTQFEKVKDDLAKELGTKISTLKERLYQPNLIFDDEIAFYLDIVKSTIKGE